MSIELKEAAQQALEAIQDLRGYRPDIDKAISALRTAIQQPATPEPVGQVSDLFPSVRNKLHAKGFDSDAPLYTHPAPGVPRGAVNLGAHSLASELAQAVAQDDDDPEGHDMSAGLFGPTVSAWLRKVAADFLSHPAPGVPDDVVKDAERYRWLRENGTLGFSGAPSWRASVSFDAVDAYAQTLDSNIDAALAQKGQP